MSSVGSVEKEARASGAAGLYASSFDLRDERAILEFYRGACSAPLSSSSARLSRT